MYAYVYIYIDIYTYNTLFSLLAHCPWRPAQNVFPEMASFPDARSMIMTPREFVPPSGFRTKRAPHVAGQRAGILDKGATLSRVGEATCVEINH